MFPPAEVLKHVDVSDYKDMDEARKLIFDLIVQYRRMKNAGVVGRKRAWPGFHWGDDQALSPFGA